MCPCEEGASCVTGVSVYLCSIPSDVLNREEALVCEVGAALVQVVVEGEERGEDELNVKLVL